MEAEVGIEPASTTLQVADPTCSSITDIVTHNTTLFERLLFDCSSLHVFEGQATDNWDLIRTRTPKIYSLRQAKRFQMGIVLSVLLVGTQVRENYQALFVGEITEHH